MDKKVKLYVVVPCYNEEEVLPETSKRLLAKFKELWNMGKIHTDSKIVFVNDGSKDKTWDIITDLCKNSEPFGSSDSNAYAGINLAHNAGHQNAVLAGLMTVKDMCDVAITMDADLQDDIEAVNQMLYKYVEEGCEVVYGVRNKRDKDTFFKRFTAEGFYKLMQSMGVDIVFNHADYRLMSSRVLKELANYKEVNLFLRGIIPTIGFKHDNVYYERAERFAGESKYPLKKMLAFAINGITSFSVKPLRLITTIGIAMTFISIVMFIWSVVDRLIGDTVTGWSSLMCSIWFIGGLQLLSLGVIGEYIGKIYQEVKARPRFIVGETIGIKENTDGKQENTQD